MRERGYVLHYGQGQAWNGMGDYGNGSGHIAEELAGQEKSGRFLYILVPSRKASERIGDVPFGQ
jgi:hypothetical protein